MFLLLAHQTKHQQNFLVYAIMPMLHATTHLSGETTDEIEIISYTQLDAIGKQTGNAQLSQISLFYQTLGQFWMREYMNVAKLSEKYPVTPVKRVTGILRVFFEGISFFGLARDTKVMKWRIMAEEATTKMAQYVCLSPWNYESKHLLLQAELHYTKGDLKSAETAYKASIQSAKMHQFLNDEALAYELYGIFRVENHMVNSGVNHLQVALSKYKEWGAMKKVQDLQLFIDLVDPNITHTYKS